MCNVVYLYIEINVNVSLFARHPLLSTLIPICYSQGKFCDDSIRIGTYPCHKILFVILLETHSIF